MVRFFVVFSIRFYQLFISSLLGPNCRFIPTCSQYTIEAVEVYGPVKGLLMGVWRLARCHPFCKGGYDPVIKPDNFRNNWSTTEWKEGL
jgi:uncharacterized protein